MINNNHIHHSTTEKPIHSQTTDAETSISSFRFKSLIVYDRVWYSKMIVFIKDHITELEDYDYKGLEYIYTRLERFQRGSGLPGKSLSDAIHANAVNELVLIFTKHNFQTSIQQDMIVLLNKYYIRKQFQEFEEIAFILSILAHCPKLRFFDNMLL